MKTVPGQERIRNYNRQFAGGRRYIDNNNIYIIQFHKSAYRWYIPSLAKSSGSADFDDLAFEAPATDFKVFIPGGQSSGTLKIYAPDDPDWLEGDEEIELTGSQVGFTFGSQTVSILDMTSLDPDNLAIILEAPAQVTEGNSVTITARLAKPNLKFKGDLQVDLLFNNTASAADYSIPDTKIIIPEGSNSATIQLDALTDTEIESGELVKITGWANMFGMDLLSSEVSIEIQDPPSHKIKFTATPLTLTEGPAGVTVTASLEYGVAAADIPISLQIGAGSTATSADFTTTPATIKIPAGSQSGTFTLYATDDQLLETQETLELSGTSTGYTFEGLTFQINDLQSANANNKRSPSSRRLPPSTKTGTLPFGFACPRGLKPPRTLPLT